MNYPLLIRTSLLTFGVSLPLVLSGCVSPPPVVCPKPPELIPPADLMQPPAKHFRKRLDQTLDPFSTVKPTPRTP
jgi:hypothetical protein